MPEEGGVPTPTTVALREAVSQVFVATELEDNQADWKAFRAVYDAGSADAKVGVNLQASGVRRASVVWSEPQPFKTNIFPTSDVRQ